MTLYRLSFSNSPLSFSIFTVSNPFVLCEELSVGFSDDWVLPPASNLFSLKLNSAVASLLSKLNSVEGEDPPNFSRSFVPENSSFWSRQFSWGRLVNPYLLTWAKSLSDFWGTPYIFSVSAGFLLTKRSWMLPYNSKTFLTPSKRRSFAWGNTITHSLDLVLFMKADMLVILCFLLILPPSKT